jgi:hypothetical protein
MSEPVPFADPILRMWVHLVNIHPENSVPIIITTGGATIYGELRSGRTYFDGIGQLFKKTLFENLDEYALAAEGSIRRLGDVYDQDMAVDQIAHLHIKNATIFLPGGNVTRMEWWRGRVDMVTGFALFGSDGIEVAPLKKDNSR